MTENWLISTYKPDTDFVSGGGQNVFRFLGGLSFGLRSVKGTGKPHRLILLSDQRLKSDGSSQDSQYQLMVSDIIGQGNCERKTHTVSGFLQSFWTGQKPLQSPSKNLNSEWIRPWTGGKFSKLIKKSL